MTEEQTAEEKEEYEMALNIAAQLKGLKISKALYILKDLTPCLIQGAHYVDEEAIALARETLFSGGEV